MRGQNVELEAVEVPYPNGFTAVHRTDLTVQAGEFFSILGPSGCGKTTILRAVSGFVEPSAGKIKIGGTDMRGRGPNARPTALIFQNLALFPLMPVWENVAFGLEARGMSRRNRRAKADELLQLVALSDQADKKPTELSGGQRQRVAIARALAVDPAVLLLDEPTAGLTKEERTAIGAILVELAQEHRLCILLIEHDLDFVQDISSRVVVLHQGALLMEGTVAEVIGSELVQSVYSGQAGPPASAA